MLARVCAAVARGRDGVARREIARALAAGVHVENVREAILQTYLFAGYPRAINGLWTLRELDRRPVTPTRFRGSRRAGERLCRRIYGRDYEPMMANMRRLSPDLADWIIEEGYGKVLSRPRLGAAQRELLVVATLAALDAWRQLAPHVRGARRVGATRADLAAVMRAVRGLVSAQASRVVVRELKEES